MHYMAKANDDCNDLCGATPKNISHHAHFGASIGAYHVQPIILIVLPKLALKVDLLTSCFFIRHPHPHYIIYLLSC
jgi:hypothetical protein